MSSEMKGELRSLQDGTLALPFFEKDAMITK